MGAYVDTDLMDTTYQLSRAAYCFVELETFDWAGLSTSLTGFQLAKKLKDANSELEGFIGYLPSDNTIYVSYRGATDNSTKLWILDTRLIDFDYWPECKGCKVHAGMYTTGLTIL